MKSNKKLNISKVILQLIVAFSMLFNIATLMLYNIEKKENAYLETALETANADKDSALQCMAIIQNERDIVQQQLNDFENIEDYQYMGEFDLTAYCCEKYEHICGTGNGITASGLPVEPGMIAVDPAVIPLGSIVMINGTKYLAADTGGAIKGNHIDIAVETHQDAINFGVQSAHVWIVAE